MKRENYEQLEEALREQIRYVDADTEGFPTALRVYPRMPKGIYVLGQTPDPLKKSVAIVGARNCSEYGRAEAIRFGRTLSAHGVQIISGMAAGIDAWAQHGALQGGTPTFSVVGTGVDICYPKRNRRLYHQIVAAGGGILSEFEPGDLPYAWHFPIRNRIISALADLVIVVEAKIRSGSLITADYANEQGKDIFAVPGRNQDELSQGCNRLIAQGAGIAWNPEMILDALGIAVDEEKLAEMARVQKYGLSEGRTGKRAARTADDAPLISTYDHYNKKKREVVRSIERYAVGTEQRRLPPKWEHADDFQKIYGKLSLEPQSLDGLQRATGLSVTDLSRVLIQLCLSGFAEETAPGHYIKI